MARIFLSHASGDNLAASRIKAWLEEQGFLAAFLDFDSTDGIPPGADWEKTLYREMERCQALLILQTPNWSASRWCFAEFAQARALGKPIFQVVEDDPSAAEAPIAPDLQRLDLRRDRQANLRQLRRELERLALQDQGGFAWPPAGEPNRPPFPGLMVFEAEDAAVFFGRDEDWRAVIERLNTRRVQGGPRLLVLQGSSGSGKSSLLRAGVLPRLRRAGRQWLVLPTLRPQLRPLESLAQTLAVALGRPEAWRELHRQLAGGDDPAELRSHWAGWVADLRLAARAPEAQLLLPIDQGEELFAVAEAPERERLLAVLADALKQPLPLQALMTIRADAMGHLQAVAVLAKTFEAMPLAPLSLERYREIIEGPARLAGLRVEAAFVERAIRDTSTEDALPLLAFALRQLHDRYGAAGQLSLNDYLALGDARSGLSPLENAVRRAADGVVTLSTNPEALRALRQAFVPAMVQVSEKGAFTRRAALWDALPEAARPLLEALVAARLLVRRQAEGQPSTVEVAHEALLRVWPLLRGWLEESRDFLLGSQQLEQDLALWQAAAPADQPQALLSGLKLAKGSAWLAECADQLRPDLRRFILASQRRARLQRGLLLASAAVVGMALTGAAGVAHWQLRQTRIAQALRFSVTHQALLSSDPFMSVVYGLAAARSLIGQRDPWAAAQLSQSLSQALEANVARSAPIATGQGEVINLVALPNGDVLSAGGRGIVRRWRGERPLDGGKLVVSGQRVVMSLAVLPNGEVVSGGQDGTLRRWRFGQPLRPAISTGQKAIYSLVALRNGDLISGGEDGSLRRWREGRPLGPPIHTGQGAVWSLLELRNGEVISGGETGSLRRWRDGRPVGDGRPIATGQEGIWSLLELRNGELISGGEDGSLRRWRDGAPAGDGRPIATGQEAVWSLLERANGEWISGGSDGSLRIWRDGVAVDGGRPIATGQGEVHSLIERPNGRLISGGGDGTLRFWQIDRLQVGGQRIPTRQPGVRSLLRLRDGSLVSGGEDGSLRRWRDGQPMANPMPAGRAAVTSLLELANGEWLSGDATGVMRRWRANQPVGLPIATGQGEVLGLAELKSGDVVSAGANGTLQRWRDGQPLGEAIAAGVGPVHAVLALANGDLISGGADGMLRHWRDGKPLGSAVDADQDAVWSLLELSNGEVISGGEDGTLRRWRNDRPLDGAVMIATTRGGGLTRLVELDGGAVLSAGADGMLRQWRGGRRVGGLIATGQGKVRGLIALGSGDLISAGSDGTLHRWSLPGIVRTACAQIDLTSITGDIGLDAVVAAAKHSCQRVGPGL